MPHKHTRKDARSVWENGLKTGMKKYGLEHVYFSRDFPELMSVHPGRRGAVMARMESDGIIEKSRDFYSNSESRTYTVSGELARYPIEKLLSLDYREAMLAARSGPV